MNTHTEFYPTVPVVDLDRAKKFYIDILGFSVVDESVPSIAMMQNGTHGKLMLFQRPPTKADNAIIGFVVDIDQAVDELNSKGVHMEQYDMGEGMKTDERGILRYGNTAAAWFKDTESNILSLHGKM